MQTSSVSVWCAAVGLALAGLAGCGSSSEEPTVKPRDASAVGQDPYLIEHPVYIRAPDIPEDNPMTKQGVELGRHLFYDVRLSGPNTQSCASCHKQEYAFTDGLAVAKGAHGRSIKRNTMALVNLAWAPQFMWDGKVSSIEEQVLLPIQHPDEMDQDLNLLVDELRADPDYVKRFSGAFDPVVEGEPESAVTTQNVARALAQFVRSLVSFNAPIDGLIDEQFKFNDQQHRGADLLTEMLPRGAANGTPDLCNECHNQLEGLAPNGTLEMMGLFTGRGYASNGLPVDEGDKGREEVTGRIEDIGLFSIPTIRNIAVTGPYMHDGRFETLEEVVRHYNEHIQATADDRLKLDGAPMKMGLTDEDVEAIVELLNLFTDERFLTNPAYGDPNAEASEAG